jgi:putative FmdB family regulatory protein
MPIYGYACKSCGREFEMLVRASETPVCPACDSSDLDQKLSLIAAPAKAADAPMCEAARAGACGMCCGACE